MISGSSILRKYIAWYESIDQCSSKTLLWVSKNVFLRSLVKICKCDLSSQMTMTARIVSKFCARTRSERPDIFFLDLTS